MTTPIYITGMGMVSPLGDDVPTTWKTLTNCSVWPAQKTHHITSFGQAKRRNITGLLRAQELVLNATQEALGSARLLGEKNNILIDPDRIGCTVSASKPLFDGDQPIPPDAINDFMARGFGLAGERRNVVAACATGAYSIALAASWIEQGLCDVVVAGSVEPYPHPLIQAGFGQMGVLSPEGTTRPFDRERSGFHFGEGAGIIVLESAASLKRRAAKPCARLSGWGLGADSHSAVAFNSNGAQIAKVIDRALQKAELSADQVQHVNAHGTGTLLNDRIETQALEKAFGAWAPHLMISGTKASTGHLLGASGAVEFIFTVLALQHQFVPPTQTLDRPDPTCALDYTPKTGHAAALHHAVSLSFGFGGSIGVLCASISL